MKFSRLVVAALVGWLFVEMLAAAPQFVQGPSARWGHCMAYDSQRQVTVLFGGQDDQTWEWDGVAWSQKHPVVSPSPRGACTLVYDSVRAVCVLFGGGNDPLNPTDETWEWDGAAWSQVVTALRPPGRRYHASVYDVQRGVVVVHGGWSGSSELSDTWEFDGIGWANVSNVGPSLENPAYAYDATRQYMLLHGGTSGGAFVGQTWAWDGSSWSLMSSSGPSPRHLHAMTFDSNGGECVLFGGRFSQSGSSNETWRWDGSAWILVPVSFTPPPKIWIGGSMCFDVAREECVLFGGTLSGSSAVFDDTWVLRGSHWIPKLGYTTSPVNGNRYALTPPMTWQEAEQLAVLEGGHLATVRSQAEQGWLWSNFGGSEPLLIGFSDVAAEGQWVWSSGESVAYTNWRAGAPDNHLGAQHWAHLSPQHAGQWDDGVAGPYKAIVEIPQPVSANSITYGTGCGSPALTMTPSVPPLISSVASTTISNAPLPFGGVTLGFSDTVLGGLPILPFSLTGLGMPGCFLWHSNEISGLPIVPVSPGVLSFSAAIPGNANLLGTHVYLQAYCVDPNASPRKLITSNGVDWTIGNQ